MALHRAYRWGKDGIGGLSDEEQRICFFFRLLHDLLEHGCGRRSDPDDGTAVGAFTDLSSGSVQH